MQISDTIQFILFDFDNTIATLDIEWTQWHFGVGRIFQKYDSTFNTHLKGEPIHMVQNDMYRKYGKKFKNDVDIFVKNYELQQTKGIYPITRTLNLIDSLFHLHKRLYIWSSNHSAMVNKYLIELGIIDKFNLIICRDMVDFIKPDKSGFTKYFASLSKNMNSFLLVGDSLFDREAAKNCGIRYVDITDI